MSAFVIIGKIMKNLLRFVFSFLVIILKNSEHIVHVCSKKLPSNELKKSLKYFNGRLHHLHSFKPL